MNTKNRESPIVFLSESDIPIGELVKRLARGHGFEWKPLSGYPSPANSSVVIVLPFEFKPCADMLEKPVSACYHLYLGVDFSNRCDGNRFVADIDKCNQFAVFADWMLAECREHGRAEIVFESPDDIPRPQLNEFERLFSQSLRELIRCDAKVRPEAAAIQEKTVLDYLRKLRASAESRTDENGIETDDLDYLVGLFENGFDPLSIEDDYDMRAWYEAVEHGLTVLTDFLLAREIGAARWSYEDSPMMLACRRGDCGLVRKMLEQGWNPNHATDVEQETPLTCAAESGSEELFFLLLEHGAELDYVGYDHELTTDPAGERFKITPDALLDHAKKGKNERICRWLEERGPARRG